MRSTSYIDSTPSLPEALRLQHRGDYGAAEKMYHALLQADPTCADAWHLLGLIALQRGNCEQAIANIREALQLNPHHAAYHYNLAHAYKQHGALREAAASYRVALELQHDDSDTLNNLGSVLLDLGESTAALACFAQALHFNPNDAQIHCNSGHALLATEQPDAALQAFHAALEVDENYVPAHHAVAVLLQQRGDLAQSQHHYQRALQLEPNNASLHIDFGIWHQAQDQLTDAAICYQNAITLDAEAADAWNNLGAVQQAQGALRPAARSYKRALRSAPGFALAHKNLASVYQLLGEHDAAIEHYRTALRIQPDFAAAEFELAALVGDSRAAPPPNYVAGLFDQYAGEYDAHMTDVLGYDVPSQLRALVTPHIGQRPLEVLDLGCGTGLCGALFHDLAKSLVGIDLSPKMIQRAREREIYRQLIIGDVVNATTTLHNNFDLILAADVFVYLGHLDPLFAAVQTKLVIGGLFAFSVERGEGDGYTLRAGGRYAHTPAYLHDLATQHGFVKLAEQHTVLRKDYGNDIYGILWLLKKTA